jgi:hypothetical protein
MNESGCTADLDLTDVKPAEIQRSLKELIE